MSNSVSCCREPKVRGGKCENCGEWIGDMLPTGQDVASEVYERMVAYIAIQDVPSALEAAGLPPARACDVEAVKGLALPTVDLVSAVASVAVDLIIQDVVAFSKSRAAQ